MEQFLRKKTFTKAMRGYDIAEVDAYVETLLKKYSELSNENNKNKKNLREALLLIKELKENSAPTVSHAVPSSEALSQNSLLLDKARAEEQRILAEAKAKAERIVRDAEAEARQKAVTITEQAKKSAAEAEILAKNQSASAEKMYKAVFAFRDTLFDLYNDHIEMLEHIAEEANTYYDTIADADISGDHIFDESAAAESVFTAKMTPQPVESAAPEESGSDLLYDGLGGDDEETFLTLSASENDKEAMSEPLFEEASMLPYEESACPAVDEEDDIIPDDLLTDEAYFEDTDGSDVAKYLDLMESADEEEEIPIRIDWSTRSGTKKAPVSSAFPEPEEEEEISSRISDDDFHDIDALFAKGGRKSDDISLTDEFDIVYSSCNSEKNMAEIVKQPLVAPERPTNPKKHKFI